MKKQPLKLDRQQPPPNQTVAETILARIPVHLLTIIRQWSSTLHQFRLLSKYFDTATISFKINRNGDWKCSNSDIKPSLHEFLLRKDPAQNKADYIFTELDMSDSNLNDQHLRQLCDVLQQPCCRNLVMKLNLANNQIFNIKCLQNLTFLNELNLDNNLIANIESIGNLHNLKRLYLGKNQITSIECLENLTELKILNLANQLRSIGIQKENEDLDWDEECKYSRRIQISLPAMSNRRVPELHQSSGFSCASSPTSAHSCRRTGAEQPHRRATQGAAAVHSSAPPAPAVLR